MTDTELDQLLSQLDVLDAHRGLLLNVVAYLAKRTKVVKTQAILAALYGAVRLYGVKGAAVITLKMAKEAQRGVAPTNRDAPNGVPTKRT